MITNNITNIILDNTDVAAHLIDKDLFELYIVALEIRDEDNILDPIKDILIFPVNPDSLMYVKKTLTSIKKSFTGIHINDNNSFVPSPLSLNGSFGIKPKIVIGKNFSFKTGFGVIKQLYNLVKLSKSTNSKGKPYRTIFYCLPFSEVFTVEINEIRFQQSVEKNRIWNYDLQMTAVAPGYIGSLKDYENNFQILGLSSLNKGLNKTIDIIKDIIWE